MVSGNPAKRNIKYYHGGFPDLPVGTVLLSKNAAARLGRTANWALRNGQHSADHVYFTTDMELARSFAHALKTSFGRGHLYEVQPLGAMEADPDYAIFDDMFMAPSARIVRVVQRNIVLTPTEETRPFAKRQVWAGGVPYVDGNGYVQPSPLMQDAGWSSEVLRMLPQWVAVENLSGELSDLATQRTTEVIAASPGIGEIGQAGRHKKIGLRDDAITALCTAHYSSFLAMQAARQQYEQQYEQQQFLPRREQSTVAPEVTAPRPDSAVPAKDIQRYWTQKLRHLFRR